MLEIWKDIKDYEGLYQVSNLGRVKSLNYRRTGKARLRKLFEDKDGYSIVVLSKNGKKDTYKVHRLVAETFIPNPENKPCINHKIQGDEGKKMNMVFFKKDGTVDVERTTIEWTTVKENNKYGNRIERIAKKQSKPVLQLSLSGELIREYPSIQECGRNGFNISCVCYCCQGKRKSYKGFKWQYA